MDIYKAYFICLVSMSIAAIVDFMPGFYIALAGIILCIVLEAPTVIREFMDSHDTTQPDNHPHDQ